ncbi:hypothetical protein [Rhizobium sp. BK376]|uniref:hypothetical protein n=1 Tax=Rhizobium sp. BK376 TaxID=2512149 RepID=UPI0010472976|nr:hypothetical protein [Rhizobium sp. BK376]TCR92582.1 hypothetical protein EV561_10115 [Rhizobium sp. BK376]
MSDFGNAFKAARASGKKVFTWNGKSYTTKLKSETTAKAPKNVPTPTPKPDNTPPGDKTKDDTLQPSSTTDSSGADTPAPQQGPKPAKDVGIASAKSPIGQAAARVANAPSTPTPSNAQVRDYNAKRYLAGDVADGSPDDSAPDAPQQGPKPEGVFYAKKGSAMSKAAARRANAPVPKK